MIHNAVMNKVKWFLDRPGEWKLWIWSKKIFKIFHKIYITHAYI